MNIYKTTLLVPLIFASLSSFSQKSDFILPDFPRDSIVTFRTDDYWDDTVSIITKQIFVYNKGKEVYNLAIEFREGKWYDSTLVQTTYNNEGRIEKVSKRIVQRNECPQEISQTMFDIPLILTQPVIKPKRKQKPVPVEAAKDSVCSSIFICHADCSDSMVTEQWIFPEGDDRKTASDTTRYYPNHLVKSNVHYVDQKLDFRNDYEYTFNPNGKTFEKKWVHEARSDSFTWVSRHLVHNKDTTLVYQKIFYGSDSSDHTESEWIYNDDFKQTGYRSWKKGKPVSFVTVDYGPDGIQSGMRSYHADSTLDYEHKYFRKTSKGKREGWVIQTNYKNNYGRVDTTYSKGQMILRSYSAPWDGDTLHIKSIPRSKCIFCRYMVYDKQNRLIIDKQWDWDTGEISSVMTYEYLR